MSSTAARATWLPLFSLIICTSLKHSNLTLIHYIKKKTSIHFLELCCIFGQCRQDTTPISCQFHEVK